MNPLEPYRNILPEQFFGEDVLVVRDQVFVGEPKGTGSDNHAHTPERREGPTVYVNCVFNANGAAEGFKSSRHWWVACVGCRFLGAVEDGADVVRGGHLWFIECQFERGSAKRDVTVKGGALGVHFRNCTGLNKITLGDYTKYDLKAVYPGGKTKRAGLFSFARPPVRGVFISDCGSPVIEILHAEKPVVTGGTPRFNYPARVLLRDWTDSYFFVRAKFFKEKNPPAEDEFKIDPREL